MGRIRVAIIDDHPLFRAGVAQSLFESGKYEVVAQGSTQADAIALVHQHLPDILLLDISIPGGGLDAIAAIMEMHPNQKIVMLTVSEAGGDVSRALRSGAKGYVLKGVEADVLCQILADIDSGDAYVSPALSARLLSTDPPSHQKTNQFAPLNGLNERQIRVLQLVCAGNSNKEIAIELSLQEKTIKHELTRIFSKLRVSNRTEAAMVFSQHGGDLSTA